MAGAAGAAGADAGLGGSAGQVADAGPDGDAGEAEAGEDAPGDGPPLLTVCNGVVCDEQVSCSTVTCTIDGTTRWCRRFNGTYAWVVQAFCGAEGFPFGSTLLECDDAGLRVCCEKTGNWETSC